MLSEIWSGGQCGADQGGLHAALDLGLKMGGWMPKGWRCFVRDDSGNWIDGSRPEFAKLGLQEDSSRGWSSRTKKNVYQTDGTFWLGNVSSGGGKLTIGTAKAANKPHFIIHWRSGDKFPTRQINKFREWLEAYNIKRLNVAGNRESTQPGIKQVTYQVLMSALE